MTFSFFEPMTWSKLIMDLDSEKLKDFPDLDKEHLEEVIHSLLKKKLLKKITIDKEVGWIRIHPKRAWWKRLFPL